LDERYATILMSTVLTVGIIGCGEITDRRRAAEFEAASGVRIGAVMDIREDVAADIAERFAVPYTTDQAELLARPDIDLVYIATPHHLHAEQAVAAAEAGKHVFVEKPIAVSASEADTVIDACERAGVKLCVCEPYRYQATYQKAKELIDAGHLGEVVGTKVSVMARKPTSYWDGGYTGRVKTDWRKSRETSGGGILSTNAVHNIDGLRFLTGLYVERLSCEFDTFATPVDVEDFCVVTLRWDNGAIGVIETSSFLEDGPREETLRGDRVYGTDGELVVAEPVRVRTNESTPLGPGEEWHRVPVDTLEPAGLRLIQDFVDAIRNDTEPPISGEDGRDALAIVQAAYRAGREGEAVTLDESG
jgi:UDP-N-acetyl-2-amino-2-deoxyglucuronate dehydrogenase